MEDSLLIRQATIDHLQQLIELNIDSSRGLQEAADLVKNAALHQILRSGSQTRLIYASELQELVAAGGDQPRTSGTKIGSIHRWWLSIKSMVAQSEEREVLAEAERGEDVIKDAYATVLRENLGEPIRDVFVRHLEDIKKSHDRIKALRDHSFGNSQDVAPSSSVTVTSTRSRIFPGREE